MSGNVAEGIIGAIAFAAAFIPGVGPFASLALMYVGSSLLGHALSPNLEGIAQDQQGILRNDASTTTPLPVVYGEARIGLTIADSRVVPPTNSKLYVVGGLCHGSRNGKGIEAIREVYFDEKLMMDAGSAIQEPYLSELDFRAILKHRGTNTDVVEPAINADFPTAWPSTSKGLWVAYIVALVSPYKQDVFPSGIPNITCRVRGNRVFDPRSPTGGPDGDGYVWSDNPALCAYDYLLSTLYGCGIGSAEVDQQSFIDGANFCDQTVTVPNGAGGTTTQKRFRCNGWLDTGREPSENLQDILGSMRGMLIYDSGKFRLFIRQATTPTGFKLTTDLIVGDWKFHRPSMDEAPNLMVLTYPDPAKQDQPTEVQYPDLGASNTFLTEDNNVEARSEVQVKLVNNPYQVRQIGMVVLKERRWGVPFEVMVKEAVLTQRVGDLIEITHPTPGWVDKPAWITSLSIPSDLQGVVRLSGFTYDPNMYSYDSQDDEPVLPATNLPDPFTVQPPTNLRAFSQTRDPRIRVEWDASTDPFLYRYEIQAKRTAPAEIADAAFHPYARTVPDERSTFIPVTRHGEQWTIQVRAVNITGRVSSWVSVNHTVSLSPAAQFSVVVTARADSIEYDVTFGDNCHYVEFFTIENSASGGPVPPETSEYAAGYVRLADGAMVKKVIAGLASQWKQTLMVGYDQSWERGASQLVETQLLSAGSGPSGPPINIAETADTQTTIDFGWDNGDATAGFTRIYVDGVLKATKAIGDPRTYQVTGLTLLQTISVQLSHLKNGVESALSAPVLMTTDGEAAAPTGFVTYDCETYTYGPKTYTKQFFQWNNVVAWEMKESTSSVLGSGSVVRSGASGTTTDRERIAGSGSWYYYLRGTSPVTAWAACTPNPVSFSAC